MKDFLKPCYGHTGNATVTHHYGELYTACVFNRCAVDQQMCSWTMFDQRLLHVGTTFKQLAKMQA